MDSDPFHDRLLQIVLALPGAYEDRPWGSVHCKVAGKIFVGWGRLSDGEMEIGIRVDPTFQSMLVDSDPRFKIAKYVGKYGGVDMRLGPKPNWAEVESFIVESYRIIAPKKLVKELDARSNGAIGKAASKSVRAKAKGDAAPKAASKSAAPAKAASVKKGAPPKKAAPKSAAPAKAASAKKGVAPKKATAKKR